MGSVRKADVEKSGRGGMQRGRYETIEKKIGRRVVAVGLAVLLMSGW